MFESWKKLNNTGASKKVEVGGKEYYVKPYGDSGHILQPGKDGAKEGDEVIVVPEDGNIFKFTATSFNTPIPGDELTQAQKDEILAQINKNDLG